MEASTDGFVLAEKDLQLRGPGQFFGTRQSGLPDMHMTNVTDARLIDLARREADKVLASRSRSERGRPSPLAQRLQEFWESGAGDLSKEPWHRKAGDTVQVHYTGSWTMARC